MNNLFIEATEKTPEINFQNDGVFSIKGNSYAENVAKFFLPVIAWIDGVKLTKTKFKQLDISLNYINTSSIKQLLIIINKINSKVGNKAKINWFYEVDDEDMRSTGEDLQELCEMKFTFIEVKSKINN